jgi:hypothetical protein
MDIRFEEPFAYSSDILWGSSTSNFEFDLYGGGFNGGLFNGGLFNEGFQLVTIDEYLPGDCSLNSLSIALQGLAPVSSDQGIRIALQGFVISCDLNSGDSLDFYGGESFDLELGGDFELNFNFNFYGGEGFEVQFGNDFDIDFYGGESFDLELQLNRIFDLAFEDGGHLYCDLATQPVMKGGSDLEITDIYDSRKLVTVAVTIGEKTFEHTIFIDRIKLSHIHISTQPQIQIEKKAITIKVSGIRKQGGVVSVRAHRQKNINSVVH